jgi:hypothetical protein
MSVVILNHLNTSQPEALSYCDFQTNLLLFLNPNINHCYNAIDRSRQHTRLNSLLNQFHTLQAKVYIITY